jgi:membrane protein
VVSGYLPLLESVLSVVLFWIVLSCIYRVLPKAPVRWSDAIAGAWLAAVTWELGRQALAYLLIGDRYSAFGLIGSFIAVMLWIYYACMVLFLGAEYVQARSVDRESRSELTAPS